MSFHGNAFPELLLSQSSEGRLLTHSNRGMTLRDYFAAQALPAVLSAQLERSRVTGAAYQQDESKAAKDAYAIADAMLAECGVRADGS